MSSIFRLAGAGALAGLLLSVSGCTSTSSLGGSAEEKPEGYEYDTRDGQTETFGYQDGRGFTGEGFSGGGIGPDSATVGRVIYFDYDSATVRSASQPVIEAHVKYLLDNPAVSVLLEGHADERGTREYNIGLGDRRGIAVRELMMSLGVSAQQVSVVSYGEERPATAGSEETAYARNRRVEIAY